MATGTISVNTPVSESSNPNIVKTSKVTTVHVLNYRRYGKLVQISGNLTMASSATGTYTEHIAFTGAPIPMFPADETLTEYDHYEGFALADNNSALLCVIMVKNDGSISFYSRGQAIASKRMVFTLTYICA